MAQKKYTQLPTATTATGAEILAIVQDGSSKQKTLANTLSEISIINGGETAVLPTATKANTLYFVTAEIVSGDDVITVGSWILSKVDGANSFSQYRIKP